MACISSKNLASCDFDASLSSSRKGCCSNTRAPWSEPAEIDEYCVSESASRAGDDDCSGKRLSFSIRTTSITTASAASLE